MELLERFACLETPADRLRAVRASQGLLVLVGGEAVPGRTALLGGFRAAAHGVRVLSGACEPPFAARLLALAGEAPARRPREQEVAAIARRLFVSVRTVHHHVFSIPRKLQAGSRREAVAAAARPGTAR